MDRLRYQGTNGHLTIRPVVQNRGPKPTGLWYSVGDEWKKWCTGEEFYTSQLAVVYHLAVDEARTLRLTTPQEILNFTEDFGDPLDTWKVDWPAIAAKWGGIEIAPYQWSLRFDVRARWYYGWDVASGCLWRPEALVRYKVA